EALPERPLVAELIERPADEVVVGTAALEPDLVVVLARDQIDGCAVDRCDDRDAPGIDSRVVGPNRSVVRLRLLPRLAPLAWGSNQDVLDDAALEHPSEVPFAGDFPDDVARLVEGPALDVPIADKPPEQHHLV